MIYDFTKESKLNHWHIVNDGVMGGVSKSKMEVNEEGYGYFSGYVSLQNNGGFAMARYTMEAVRVVPEQTIKIRLKGDGKPYQFRIRPDVGLYYSYIYPFQTTGDWQEVNIPLKEMYPSFRGRRLDLPNFNHEQISEIAFFIGNKREEDFELVIEGIVLE